MPTTENVILRAGSCLCINEPKGHAGLEGYIAGDFYHFEHMSRDRYGKPYYRVYPTGPGYYETCSEQTFAKHFEESHNE